MKDLKISSKYDCHICTLENGEKLFSAEVTFHSSNWEYRRIYMYRQHSWIYL